MATLQHGTHIGKHAIGRLLGAGRSATVYETAGPDGTPRALRVLEADVRLGARDRQRFLQQWGGIAGIRHANVVGHVDAGIDGGRAWVLTDLVYGPSLRHLVRANGGQIPVDRAVDIVQQAAEGIAAAHALGIVHGDVRPENILVEPGDRVKVSDFEPASGEATARADKDLAVCLYAAPEWLTHATVATSIDVYALGLVLYELCSGVHPALGPLQTPVETCRRHILVEPPPLASLSTAARLLPEDLFPEHGAGRHHYGPGGPSPPRGERRRGRAHALREGAQLFDITLRQSLPDGASGTGRKKVRAPGRFLGISISEKTLL